MRQLVTILIFLAITSPAALAQFTPPPPVCDPPPQGASKEVADCYDDACEAYQAAWSECSNATCRNNALDAYTIALLDCQPAFARTKNEHFWITLAFKDGQWSYSFDGSAPERSVIFRY